MVLDILFASSGIEAEVAEMADVLEVLPGLRVPSPVWAICWHSNCCLATAARARRIKSIWRDYAEWPQPLTSTQLAVPWP